MSFFGTNFIYSHIFLTNENYLKISIRKTNQIFQNLITLNTGHFNYEIVKNPRAHTLL